MNKAEDEVSFTLLAIIASVFLFGGAAVKSFVGNPFASILVAGLIGVAVTLIITLITGVNWLSHNFKQLKHALKYFYLALVGPLFVIKGVTTRVNEQRSSGETIKWTTEIFSAATSLLISLFLSALALTVIWMLGIAAYFAGKHLLS